MKTYVTFRQQAIFFTNDIIKCFGSAAENVRASLMNSSCMHSLATKNMREISCCIKRITCFGCILVMDPPIVRTYVHAQPNAYTKSLLCIPSACTKFAVSFASVYRKCMVFAPTMCTTNVCCVLCIFSLYA